MLFPSYMQVPYSFPHRKHKRIQSPPPSIFLAHSLQKRPETSIFVSTNEPRMLQPLAERLRPKNLDEYIGQEHLVGPGAVLRRMIDSGKISSFILWGPPGVGKTTLAHIISQQLQAPFFTLSAVQSGVKEVREVIDRCKANIFSKVRPILFIDEIHRFSKSQQDSLLGAV